LSEVFDLKKKIANLLSKSEFARKIGVHPSHVTRLIQKGKIRATKKGKIDYDEAIKKIRVNRDPARKTKIKEAREKHDEESGGATGYQRIRIAHEGYRAKLAELEYKKRIGEVVDAKRMGSALFNLHRIIRDSLLNISDRLAPLLAPSQDKVAEYRAIIEKHVKEAIEGLDEEVMKKLGLG